MATSNTIDAKLRIAADLADAVRALKALQKELQATGSAAKAASGDPAATRGTTQAVREQAQAQREAAAAARQAAKDQVAAEREKAAAIKQAAAEKRAADRAAAASQAAAAKLARQESARAAQIAPQVTDIVTGLAGGQNPLLVAIQQGGQLRDIYGGVGNAAKALLGIFTPLRVAIGGVAGAVLALGLAYKQSYQEGDRLNRAITSTGNLAATSQGQLYGLAREIATRQKVSVSDVRETLTSLVESGQYTGQTLDVAARAVTTFSKATGQSSEEVIKSFDGMSNGVAKWAAKVNQQYGYLTAAEFERIRALESAGRTQEAVRLNLELLAQTMQQRVIPQTNLLVGAWNVAAAAAASFWDSLKGLFRDETAEDRISKLTKRVKELRELLDKGGSNTGFGRAKILKDLADTEAQLSGELNTAGRDALRRADASGSRQQAQRDIASLSSFETENRTRQATVKKFADERAAYEQAKDRLIADARLAGNVELEKRLTAEKRAFIAQQQDAERNALRAFDRETTISRVAQVRQEYDQRAELLKDALSREAALNEQALQDGLRDVASYLAERARLERAQGDAAVQELETRLAAERRALSLNQSRRAGAASANDREQFDDAIVRGQQEIARLEAQIVISKREAATLDQRRARDAELFGQQLRAQLKDIEEQTRALQGTETIGDIQSRVQDQFKPLRDEVLRLGGDLEALDRLMGLTINSRVFSKARDDFSLLTQQLALQEQRLDTQVEQGALTTEAAERQKFEARARALPQLREMLDLLGRLAQSPGDKVAVEQMRQEVDALGTQFTKLQQTMRGAIENGASTALQDYVTGVKTAKEATLDFMASILRAALNVITQRIGEQLANSLIPKGGAGGGDWLSTAVNFAASFFHGGGVVGGLQSMGRAVSPMLFATATRYHSGGMAGLAPDEVPAVLRKGEEVLTADDPRHRNNGGRGGIDKVEININISGAGGGDDELTAASGRLGRMMRATIDDWAATEARPGGILAKN